MASVRTRKFMREIQVLQDSERLIPGIFLVDFDEVGASYVKGVIAGPQGPYFGGQFEVSILLPDKWPFQQPIVTMVTKIWHPNISLAGEICLDRTGYAWSAGTTFLQILEAVQGLLSQPNFDSPNNPDAATMHQESVDMYTKTAQMWTAVHAGGTTKCDLYQDKLKMLQDRGHTMENALRRLSLNHWTIDAATRLQQDL